ncbi:polysaccharide deacetylase family protein [Heliorestis acidaminivorans]|uniref:Polysaccharide deacetylase family protein n=1 Tax=Heliorestis acidaminivorans TaxID=553427 RepID=A0A6I0EU84_9FIRM|nr:polysaccharide deacetylase family protein [Heliorestis acidaminivorans]KAB2954345.1 polysaccharide deacetylase family protein [Heliorestis acidaminivorans]
MKVFFISKKKAIITAIVSFTIIIGLISLGNLWNPSNKAHIEESITSTGAIGTEIPGVLYRGTEVNKIALAINVDWGEEYIPEILEILKQHNSKATFFFTGRFAEKLPDIVKMVFQEGHEIGNHGYSHPHPTQISSEANRREIQRTHQVLVKTTGQAPHWFAPPYGECNTQVVEVARQEGYGTVLWTVDSADWMNPAPQDWMKRVMKGIGPGAIVLMHPTKSTVQALPELLKYSHEKDWRAVTMSELTKEEKESAKEEEKKP